MSNWIKSFNGFLIKEAKLFSDIEKDSAQIEVQKKSGRWSELYLYSLFDSQVDEDGEEHDFWEIIAKDTNGEWHLLTKYFESQDHPYPTYESLSRVHGMAYSYEELKDYNLMNHTLVEILKGLEYKKPLRSKSEIELLYIDLFLDTDIFNYEGTYHFDQLYRRGKDCYTTTDKFIPKNAKACYMAYLSLDMTVNDLRSKTITAPSKKDRNIITLTKDIEKSIEVLEDMITIRERAFDDGLDFYYNFDGVFLKMLFIEK